MNHLSPESSSHMESGTSQPRMRPLMMPVVTTSSTRLADGAKPSIQLARSILDESGLMGMTCFHGIPLRYLNIHGTGERQVHPPQQQQQQEQQQPRNSPRNSGSSSGSWWTSTGSVAHESRTPYSELGFWGFLRTWDVRVLRV
jgi:hypothetical protein